MAMNTSTPSAPAWKSMPSANAEREDRHAAAIGDTVTSATMWPTRIALRRTGVSSSRSK